MDIGKLRKRIDVYEIYADTVDDIGGVTTNSAIVATVWAEVLELTGTRAALYNEAFNEQPIQIRFRTDAYDLLSTNLIKYDDGDIVIHSITKDPLKRITTVIGWRSA